MTTPDLFLFVSHVSEDRAPAMEIVDELERRGVRCWIAPRDVRPGKPFDDEIADAIEASRATLLVFSERCNESDYIRREITVAGESQKVIIPFRIEDAQPKRGLRVRLTDLHWIDGFASRERAIDELVRNFHPDKNEGVLKAPSDQAFRQPGPPVVKPDARRAPAPRRYYWLAAVVLVLIILAGVAAMVWKQRSTVTTATNTATEPTDRIARTPAPTDGGICAKSTTSAGVDEYCVSSVLKTDNVNTSSYGPGNLFDGAADTAWIEGVPGQGIGQWIVVAFDRLRLVRSIVIVNGYNKNPDLYQKNSRVKDLKIEFSGPDNARSITLEDTAARQPIPLPGDQPLKAYWIKFTIQSVYPGSKFQDTAISELRVISDPAQQ